VVYPKYYDEVESIVLYDPLADFLGALEGGITEITYLDCVKLAGHSCPTVAGAYLMAQIGLKALYRDTLPQRSKIRVEIAQREDEGVTGVTGNVIGYITGAGGIGGFKGIAGHFGRDNLLTYGTDIDGLVRLTRLDTMESVTLTYDPSQVPADPAMKPSMKVVLEGDNQADDKQQFTRMWQGRTKKILLDAEHTQIITITKETK